MYSLTSCQLKFKMRAVGVWNKMPGFNRMSSYEQVAKSGP